MLIWRHHMFSDQRSAYRAASGRLTIGRSQQCEIQLPSSYIPHHALTIERTARGWELEAAVDGCCEMAGIALASGERTQLHEGAEVRISPYVLRFETEDESRSGAATANADDDEIADLIQQVHAKLLDVLGCAETNIARDRGADHLLRMEHAIDEIAVECGLLAPSKMSRLNRLAGHAVRHLLIDRVIGGSATRDPISSEVHRWIEMVSAVPEREGDLLVLAQRVEQLIDIGDQQSIPQRMAAIESRYWPCWETEVRVLQEFLSYLAAKEIKKQVKDIVFGYGAIEDLLRLPTVTEIMVVGHETIFVEKQLKSGGTIENSGRRFVSDLAAMAVIERIVSRCNRRIDQAQPMVDARLDDGSRVNAVIPPIAIHGPVLTIRKFPQRRHRIQDWIDSGGISHMGAAFLKSAVQGRCNILIAGGTGAGKTTLLNCLADWINDRERVITIEDTAELQLAHDHVVTLQSRPANAEGEGQVATRDLVRNALRMRPDRIVVGECRGAEALDMLNAMNTGHKGSMTTIHANSPFEVANRLESMVKIGADFSESTIQEQIGAAIDLIVQVERLHGSEQKEGPRVISSIAEVRPIDPATGRVSIVELFTILREAPRPVLRPTGRLPSFGAELMSQGLLGLNVFCPGHAIAEATA